MCGIVGWIDNNIDFNTFPWFGQLMIGPQLMAYLIQLNIWLGEYKVKLV